MKKVEIRVSVGVNALSTGSLFADENLRRAEAFGASPETIE
jgi:hypothetical protein